MAREKYVKKLCTRGRVGTESFVKVVLKFKVVQGTLIKTRPFGSSRRHHTFIPSGKLNIKLYLVFFSKIRSYTCLWSVRITDWQSLTSQVARIFSETLRRTPRLEFAKRLLNILPETISILYLPWICHLFNYIMMCCCFLESIIDFWEAYLYKSRC